MPWKGGPVSLSLDNCAHCACSTDLVGYTRESAILAIARGELGCENCLYDDDSGFNDGHMACVQLLDDEEVVWDGRCQKED